MFNFMKQMCNLFAPFVGDFLGGGGTHFRPVATIVEVLQLPYVQIMGNEKSSAGFFLVRWRGLLHPKKNDQS